LVADCKDDDVDATLLAILKPTGEESSGTARPRSVLASLCLADEPNIDPATAREILTSFARNIGKADGIGHLSTLADSTAFELGNSMWREELVGSLVGEFRHRAQRERENVGGLLGMLQARKWAKSPQENAALLADAVQRLNSGNDDEVVIHALAVMEAAFERKLAVIPGLVDALLAQLAKASPQRCAAAWALGWLAGGHLSNRNRNRGVWQPNEAETSALGKALDAAFVDEHDACFWLVTALGRSRLSIAVAPLCRKLDSSDKDVRLVVIAALVKLGDKQAVAPLLAKLDDNDKGIGAAAAAALHALGEPSHLARFLASEDAGVRQAVVRAYARHKEQLDQQLLSRDLDAADPWLDPQKPVTEAQVANASTRLNIPPEQIRARYEASAVDLKLKLVWRP
jgi:HEAT repeat protein